jgi:hypothetical protein
MTDVKVALAVLLVALSILAAEELAGQRYRTTSDLSMEPIHLGVSDIEVVTPATPQTPRDLGDGTEVQVDGVVSYSRSPEYLLDNETLPPPGR